jgi:hypothetical protein
LCYCLLRNAKPVDNGSSRAQSTTWASGSAVLWCSCQFSTGEPVPWSCCHFITGELSLWAAEVLGPDFLQSFRDFPWFCCQLDLGEPSLQAASVPVPDLPHRLQGAQLCGAATVGGGGRGTTEPDGLHRLLPVEQAEPAYTEVPVSPVF